jgi:hypothetical protein
MSPRIFIYIIASFGESIYKELIKLRKLQLLKYKIDHYFLFDEDPPIDYVMNKNDVYLKKEDIISHSKINPHMNPFMIQRFLKGLQLIDETQYDYIIRVNISTFININLLLKELENKSRYQFVMAPLISQHISDWEEYKLKISTILSGTCIIMSNDIITNLKNINIYDPILHKHNDDTVISHLIKSYVKHYCNINIYLFESISSLDTTIFDTFSLYRIKNDIDRDYDILHWEYLLKEIDNIDIV